MTADPAITVDQRKKTLAGLGLTAPTLRGSLSTDHRRGNRIHE
ncbi:MAG: hypothetical protein AB7S71_07910 [Dongiaceae bacterium]